MNINIVGPKPDRSSLTEMEDWLALNETLRPAWEREATRRVSETVGYDLAVSLRLPTEADARTAWTNNITLCGAIAFKPAWGRAAEFPIPLPYEGVFVLHGDDPVENRPHLAVWSSYLLPEDKANSDRGDLAHRLCLTFPVALLRRLTALSRKLCVEKSVNMGDRRGKKVEPQVPDAAPESVDAPKSDESKEESKPAEPKGLKNYSLEGLNLTTNVPLKEIVAAVKRFREGAGCEDVDAPRLNILLSGAPGSGKTAFVKYLAHEVGAPLKVVKASDLLSRYSGETEKRIARVFGEAKENNEILFGSLCMSVGLA